jgi:hypothetical protein
MTSVESVGLVTVEEGSVDLYPLVVVVFGAGAAALTGCDSRMAPSIIRRCSSGADLEYVS